MHILKTIGSIAALIFTAGSMVTMWVFAAASLANNTSEASLQRVKLWVLNFSLFCCAGIAAGIWLLVQKRYGWSAATALVPALAMLATLLWKVATA